MFYSFNRSKSYADSQYFVRLGRDLFKKGILDIETLKGTCFEGKSLEEVNQNEVEAMFYRKALSLDSKNAQALNELGACISYGAAIAVEDLIDTPFEGRALKDINRDELEAELYRKSLAINPYNSRALINLACCLFTQGVKIKPCDLLGTRFEKALPEEVELLELEAEWYRKIILFEPFNTSAISQLARCLAKGATIMPIDCTGTRFEGSQPNDVDRYKLVTELYKKIIQKDPDHLPSIRALALEIFRGVLPLDEDLIMRMLQDQPILNKKRHELAAALFRKIIHENPKKCFNEELINLSVCILNGAALKEQDLKGSPFEGYPLADIKAIEWVAWVARKFVHMDEFRSACISNLCICFERGAQIQAKDVVGAIFETQTVKNETKAVVAALKERETQSVIDLWGDIDNNLSLSHPEEFLCPISGQLMREPVIVGDGKAYDKYSIKKWFEIKQSSPLSNVLLENSLFVPHTHLQSRIQKYVDSLRHPQSNVNKVKF